MSTKYDNNIRYMLIKYINNLTYNNKFNYK